MIPLRLEEVAEATGGALVGADPHTVVLEVTTDSRRVPPRSLFVALRGETHDGHDYVEEALSAGSVACLVERRGSDAGAAIVVDDTWAAIAELGRCVRDRVDPVVVALTGSVGKTTTKDLAAAAIGAGKRTVAARGSYNNELGVPLTCLAATDETEVLVCEIGARGVGHIAGLVAVVRPDIAIVTAVAEAHVEMFGDIDTIARAKRELVEGLGPHGTAILNADDERVRAMADHTTGRVLLYGVGGGAEVTAENVALDRLARARFDAHTPWGTAAVLLPLAGGHHVSNALAALAAAGVLGVEVEAAAAAIGEAELSPWRSEVVEADGIVVLNDAYNANPSSTRAALETLVAIERTGRTWAVLGVMAELGAIAREAHEEIGRACAKLGVDRLVVVGADARPIGEAAAGAGLDAVTTVEDAESALDVLAGDVAEGDVVLVKASRVAGLEHVADGLARGRATR